MQENNLKQIAIRAYLPSDIKPFFDEGGFFLNSEKDLNKGRIRFAEEKIEYGRFYKNFRLEKLFDNSN